MVRAGLFVVVAIAAFWGMAGWSWAQDSRTDSVTFGWVVTVSGVVITMLLAVAGTLLIRVYADMQESIKDHDVQLRLIPEKFTPRREWEAGHARVEAGLENIRRDMNEAMRRIFEKLDGKADKGGD